MKKRDLYRLIARLTLTIETLTDENRDLRAARENVPLDLKEPLTYVEVEDRRVTAGEVIDFMDEVDRSPGEAPRDASYISAMSAGVPWHSQMMGPQAAHEMDCRMVTESAWAGCSCGGFLFPLLEEPDLGTGGQT